MTFFAFPRETTFAFGVTPIAIHFPQAYSNLTHIDFTSQLPASFLNQDDSSNGLISKPATYVETEVSADGSLFEHKSDVQRNVGVRYFGARVPKGTAAGVKGQPRKKTTRKDDETAAEKKLRERNELFLGQHKSLSMPVLTQEQERELSQQIQDGYAETNALFEAFYDSSGKSIYAQALELKRNQVKYYWIKGPYKLALKELAQDLIKDKIILEKLPKQVAAKKAINILVESNIRFAIYLIRKKYITSPHVKDLVQQAILGVNDAAPRFDYRQAKFSTFAVWWMRSRINRFIKQNADPARIPERKKEEIKQMEEVIAELQNGSDRKVTAAEIAKRMEVSEDKVKELRNLQRKVASLDNSVNTDSETSWHELLADQNAVSPDQAAIKKDIRERCIEIVEEFLATETLSERQKYVLCNRFGMNESREIKTLVELGREMDLSRERIRQIEFEAKRELRFYVKMQARDLVAYFKYEED